MQTAYLVVCEQKSVARIDRLAHAVAIRDSYIIEGPMAPWLILFLPALPFLIIGCGDEKASPNSKEAEAQRAAEQRLMSDMATAAPELERRISEWISSGKGLVFVVDNSGAPSSICTRSQHPHHGM